jgi:methionine synthase I (cobalamin-dependent)
MKTKTKTKPQITYAKITKSFFKKMKSIQKKDAMTAIIEKYEDLRDAVLTFEAMQEQGDRPLQNWQSCKKDLLK